MSPSAMLQIAEPGMGDKPQAKLNLAGIDLGTTHSLVAVGDGANDLQVLSFAAGPLLPSAVLYDAQSSAVQVGAAALQASEALTSFKRLMGLTLAEAQAVTAKNSCVLCAPADEGEADDGESGQEQGVLLATPAGGKSPEEVSAEVLRVLGRRAEEALGGPLDGVVITVPAYFDEPQRQATARAAKLAGLPLLRLIAEPTAAALAYGLHRTPKGTVLVYDLGGGTFDCSVVRLTKGVFEVRASVGDTQLGGDDMDRLLAAEALRYWELEAEAVPAADRVHLLRAARSAKEQLTAEPSARLSAEICGTQRQWQVTREQFEELITPLLQRTVALCRRVLRDAKLQAAELDALVLVGGATRIPVLRQRLQDFLGRPPLTDLNPDQVVAEGALRHALSVTGAVDAPLLVDVTPLSLGLETLGGLVETVMERNTPVPAMRTREFTTARDGQTGLLLHVVQGERELVEHCRSLARFKLAGIPPMAAGSARIRVSFQLDENGLLQVSAVEQTSGVCASVQTRRAAELSAGELKHMLRDAQGAADDGMARQRQRRVEAEALLSQVRSALEQDGALLAPQRRQPVDAAIGQLEQALAAADETDEAAGTDLQRAVERLAEASEDFAQLRMDAAVQRAFKGKGLDEVESLAK